MAKKFLPRVAAMLGGIALLFSLAGCSAPITSGVIVAKDFKEAHTVYDSVCASRGYVYEFGTWLNPSTGSMESGYRNVYKCTSYEDVPREVPASYKLVIEGQSEGSEDLRTATYPVTEELFERASLGYIYDSETGELKAR